MADQSKLTEASKLLRERMIQAAETAKRTTGVLVHLPGTERPENTAPDVSNG